MTPDPLREQLARQPLAAYPRGVTDPLCPRGAPISTPTDHRLLWHLETELRMAATTEHQRRIARELSDYLHATCDHHWHHSSTDEDESCPAEHWQCLWCHAVEWDGTPSSGACCPATFDPDYDPCATPLDVPASTR